MQREPRFDGPPDSYWTPPDPPDIDLLTERYVNSGEFTMDALDWAGIHAHRHADLVSCIEDYYADSPEFASVLEDIADGERLA
jgi:hypothetical protein